MGRREPVVGRSLRRPGLLVACAAILISMLGCRPAGEVVRGTIYNKSAEHGVVTIAHATIPGVMEAGERPFSVPNRALMESLEPGQVIEFRIVGKGGRRQIVDVDILGWTEDDERWIEIDGRYRQVSPAPGFDLVDQDGAAVSLQGLAGRVLLLDFVYTNCPGPCPMQTANHVNVQRGLSPVARDRVRFVSVTMDPVRDDGDTLREYAKVHGADLTGWSFLRGDEARIDEMMDAWGMAAAPGEDGTIDHMSLAFLLDDRGRIVEYYMGPGQDPGAIRKDVEALVAAVESRLGGS
jgi:protein SCO1/2